MSRRKQTNRSQRKNRRQQPQQNRATNKAVFKEVLNWFAPENELFAKEEFHGNTKWNAEQLTAQALIWSWQEAKNVTDAFDQTLEICKDLGCKKIAMSYTSLINALNRYDDVFQPRLRERFQTLTQEVAGRYGTTNGWVLIGFDGSRVTAPGATGYASVNCADTSNISVMTQLSTASMNLTGVASGTLLLSSDDFMDSCWL